MRFFSFALAAFTATATATAGSSSNTIEKVYQECSRAYNEAGPHFNKAHEYAEKNEVTKSDEPGLSIILTDVEVILSGTMSHVVPEIKDFALHIVGALGRDVVKLVVDLLKVVLNLVSLVENVVSGLVHVAVSDVLKILFPLLKNILYDIVLLVDPIMDLITKEILPHVLETADIEIKHLLSSCHAMLGSVTDTIEM